MKKVAALGDTGKMVTAMTEAEAMERVALLVLNLSNLNGTGAVAAEFVSARDRA